jgi:hypothetical protein
MTDFANKGYAIVRGFLDPTAVATVSRYMEYTVKSKGGAWEDPTSKYAFYGDPLIETILYNSREEIEQVSSLELDPTYAYSRVYIKGDELKKHVDRPSCEVSVTVNVAINGEPWAIWCQYPGHEPVECVLNPGDAVVYQGCVVEHWREPLQHADFNAQFMLHYVDKNGPNASHKWDHRPSLGLPSSARRM